MSPEERGCCEPELIFELADGGLDPERKRAVQNHLESCPACRELYKRELDLNNFLDSFELSVPRQSRAVSRGVAMALPTRPIKARLLWSLLAGALLTVALLALELNGTNLVVSTMGTLGMLWSFAEGFADALQNAITAAATPLLAALAVGAVLDLLIAVAVFSAARRARRA